MNRYQKNIYIVIFFIFISGFLIRLYFTSFHDGVIGDAEVYLNASKGVFDLSVPYSYQPTWPDEKFIAQPLYPVIIAIFSLFTQDTLFAGQLVSILFGSLLIIVIYLTGKKIFNETVGLISAFIASIYNVTMWNSLNVMTESLYTFIFILIIYFVYQSVTTNRLSLFFVTGAMIGLGFLCRAFGLINLFVAILLAVIIAVLYRQQLKQTCIRIVILFTGFMFVTAAYFIYLRTELGIWTLGHQFTKTTHQYEKVYDNKSVYIKGDVHDKVIYEVKDHSNYISFMISELSHGYVIQFYSMVRKGDAIISVFPLVFLIFIITGIIYHKHENSKIDNLVLILFLLSLPLFLPLLKVTNRYLSPIVPVGILYMSAAVFYITQKITDRIKTHRFRVFQSKSFWYALFLCFIFLVNLPGLLDPVQKKAQFPKNYRYIGEWLKEYSPGKDFILSNTFIDIYSDDYRFKIAKKNSFSDIYIYAKQKNVKFLVVENNLIQPYPKITIDDLTEKELKSIILLKEFNQPRNFKIYQFIF